jgi:hypothetical protein
MRISKRTQRAFGDFCSDYGVLRTIRDAFEAEDFVEDENFEDENVWGQRRTLAASFHSGIDPDDSEQQKRLLRVYLNAIDDWGRGYVDGELNADAKKLVRALQRDGHRSMPTATCWRSGRARSSCRLMSSSDSPSRKCLSST